jgi:hypothetical protein
LKNNYLDFLLAILIVSITVFFSIAAYMRWMGLSFFVGSLRFSHWLSIIGTIYIAIATPAFVILKRFHPQKMSNLYRFHIFGNLAFFTLISIHFASQMGRPVTAFPDLGTGLAMYIAMALQVASGFTQRFRFTERTSLKTNMFVHSSLVMVFYIVMVFHVLHGFGFL